MKSDPTHPDPTHTLQNAHRFNSAYRKSGVNSATYNAVNKPRFISLKDLITHIQILMANDQPNSLNPTLFICKSVLCFISLLVLKMSYPLDKLKSRWRASAGLSVQIAEVSLRSAAQTLTSSLLTSQFLFFFFSLWPTTWKWFVGYQKNKKKTLKWHHDLFSSIIRKTDSAR